jgi:hypothetical protein
MKHVLIAAGFFILLCGCDKKSPALDAQARQTTEVATPVESSAASPKASTTATAEQIGSSVRVRVIAGGLPVKNVTGAILHREELSESGGAFDNNRCVLALLEGWTEEQLRSEQARFLIYRNLPDAQGELQGNSYAGKLIQFDAATGVAAIAFAQGFSATTDLGFMIDRSPVPAGQAVALRFHTDAAVAPALPSSPERAGFSRTFAPMLPVSASFSMEGNARLNFPPPGADVISDESALIVTAPRLLRGFATGSETARFVPIPPMRLGMEIPTITPVSAAFAEGSSSVQMTVDFELKNVERPPRRLWLRKTKIAAGGTIDLEAFTEPYQPIPGAGQDTPLSLASGAKQFQTSLAASERFDEESSYLVQLAWQMSETERLPTLSSRPFLVKISRKPSGVVVETRGITNLSSATPEPEGQVATFPLEAPVIGIFEIAGGREVLMQLQGEPFWKRFSLEKKEWLPLPPANLLTVAMAGNRSNLFVLDIGCTAHAPEPDRCCPRPEWRTHAPRPHRKFSSPRARPPCAASSSEIGGPSRRCLPAWNASACLTRSLSPKQPCPNSWASWATMARSEIPGISSAWICARAAWGSSHPMGKLGWCAR